MRGSWRPCSPSGDGCGMENAGIKSGEIQCCQNFLELPWSRMDLCYLAHRFYLFQIAGGIPVRKRIRRNRRNASVHSWFPGTYYVQLIRIRNILRCGIFTLSPFKNKWFFCFLVVTAEWPGRRRVWSGRLLKRKIRPRMTTWTDGCHSGVLIRTKC